MRPLFWILLSALVLVLAALSLLTGVQGIDGPGVLAALAGGEGPMVLVMQEIRAPRTALALVIGAGLGLAGAAMQGFLRNPLAEPGLLGVSGAAALGAVLALQSGLAAGAAYLLPAVGLGFAFAAGLLLALLAGPRGGSLALILAGVGISALTGAGVSLALNLSPDPFAANEAIFWLMGSLADRSWLHVGLAAPFILAGMALLLTLGRDLEALTLGEEAAETMGTDLGRLRLKVMLGVAAIAGAATSVAGSIGFVGLVVPHLLRGKVAARPALLLPASALGGAALVLAADIAVRLILPGRDLKIGVLMALIGAPFFLHLILRHRFSRQ